MSALTNPASLISGRLRTRYFDSTLDTFAAISMNSLPVGGFGAAGTRHVRLHAESDSASSARLFPASGVKVQECRTMSLTSQEAFAPWANLSKTNRLATLVCTRGP